MRPLHRALSCCCGHWFSTGLTGTGIRGHSGQGGSRPGWPWHRGIEICCHWPLALRLGVVGLCLEVTFSQPGSFMRKAKGCQGLGPAGRASSLAAMVSSACTVAGPPCRPYTSARALCSLCGRKAHPQSPGKSLNPIPCGTPKQLLHRPPHCHSGTYASQLSQRCLLSNRQWLTPLCEEAPQTTTRKPAQPISPFLAASSVFLSLPLCVCLCVSRDSKGIELMNEYTRYSVCHTQGRYTGTRGHSAEWLVAGCGLESVCGSLP